MNHHKIPWYPHKLTISEHFDGRANSGAVGPQHPTKDSKSTATTIALRPQWREAARLVENHGTKKTMETTHVVPLVVGGWGNPLWKIWVRQLGLLFPIYGKIKHVPNHQPVWWWLNEMFWGDFMEYIYEIMNVYPVVSSNMENPRTDWGLISRGKSPISMVHSCPFSSRPCLTTGEYLDSLNVSGYCGWLRNPAIDRGSTIQFRDIGKKTLISGYLWANRNLGISDLHCPLAACSSTLAIRGRYGKIFEYRDTCFVTDANVGILAKQHANTWARFHHCPSNVDVFVGQLKKVLG